MVLSNLTFKNTKSYCFFSLWYCTDLKCAQCTVLHNISVELVVLRTTDLTHILQFRGTAGCLASFCLQTGKTHQMHTAMVVTRIISYQTNHWSIQCCSSRKADQIKRSSPMKPQCWKDVEF